MKKSQFIAGLLVVATLSGVALAHATLSQAKVTKASPIDMEAQVVEQTKDEAYEENQEEEKYIVNLVSSKTGQKLDVSNWKECLEYLESNYDQIMADPLVETEKVESYVTAYQLVENDLNPIETEESTAGEVVTAARPNQTGEVATGTNNGYDPQKAIAYMEEWYDDYNPAYPCYSGNGYGGDCANFVSQCLKEGGKQMKGTKASNFSNWFCRTSNTEEFSKVSSTWRGAEAFASYWKQNALEYKDFAPETCANRVAFDELYEYANPGDAISYINSNGRPYHTVIVSYKNKDNDREIRFAAHTSSQIDRSVYDYCSYGEKTVRVYKMSTPSQEELAKYELDMTDDEIQQKFFEGPYEVVEEDNNSYGDIDNDADNTNSGRGFWSRLFGRR